MKKIEEQARILTVGEIVDELKKLPRQTEVFFSDVCGNQEAELYQIHIDAINGKILFIGEYINE